MIMPTGLIRISIRGAIMLPGNLDKGLLLMMRHKLCQQITEEASEVKIHIRYQEWVEPSPLRRISSLISALITKQIPEIIPNFLLPWDKT